MKIIAIGLIFLSIIGAGFIVYYFGFVKNIISENLFGKADVFSDGFQFIGEVDLDNDEAVNLGDKEIIQPKLAKKSTKSTAWESVIENQPVITSKVAIDTGIVAATSAAPTSVAPAAIVATTAIAMIATEASTTAPVLISAPQEPVNAGNHIIISEVLVGIDGNANYEFVELYNPNSNAIDLTGWAIKKRNSKNNEDSLVSISRFKGKKIMPNKYFLLAKEGGYNGAVLPDVVWPESYILAYKNNAIILYNANGEAIEDVGWDEIAKGQSLERVSISDWTNGDFKVQNNPNPQNSSY